MSGFQDSAVLGNKFMFHCGTVDRDVPAIVCFFKRKKHLRGERTPDQDCLCAMNASRCPAVKMLSMEANKRRQLFYDDQARMHDLPTEILDELSRKIILPFHAKGLDLTAEQHERFFGANSPLKAEPRAYYGQKSHNLPMEALRSPARSPAKPPTITRKPRAENITDALSSGGSDMSTLINKSLEEAAQ